MCCSLLPDYILIFIGVLLLVGPITAFPYLPVCSTDNLNVRSVIPPERGLDYGLRRVNTFNQPKERTNRYLNTYFQNCPKEWNQLEISV